MCHHFRTYIFNYSSSQFSHDLASSSDRTEAHLQCSSDRNWTHRICFTATCLKIAVTDGCHGLDIGFNFNSASIQLSELFLLPQRRRCCCCCRLGGGIFSIIPPPVKKIPLALRFTSAQVFIQDDSSPAEERFLITVKFVHASAALPC